MIFDNMLTQNSVLETAMQASMVRKDVILNNIANVDTPGYKKKSVLFEQSLRESIRQSRATGSLDLSKAVPRVSEIHENFNYRIDGNNVDIETEMVDLYENSIRYDTMANSVMSNYKRINMVLMGR